MLIVGGSTGISFLGSTSPQGAPAETALNTAELYNPATDTFTAVSAPIPGCPAGESAATMPACTNALPSVCALPTALSPIIGPVESGTTVTVTMQTANPTGLTVGSTVSSRG